MSRIIQRLGSKLSGNTWLGSRIAGLLDFPSWVLGFADNIWFENTFKPAIDDSNSPPMLLEFISKIQARDSNLVREVTLTAMESLNRANSARTTGKTFSPKRLSLINGSAIASALNYTFVPLQQSGIGLPLDFDNAEAEDYIRNKIGESSNDFRETIIGLIDELKDAATKGSASWRWRRMTNLLKNSFGIIFDSKTSSREEFANGLPDLAMHSAQNQNIWASSGGIPTTTLTPAAAAITAATVGGTLMDLSNWVLQFLGFAQGAIFGAISNLVAAVTAKLLSISGSGALTTAAGVLAKSAVSVVIPAVTGSLATVWNVCAPYMPFIIIGATILVAVIRNSRPKHLGGYVVTIAYKDEAQTQQVLSFAHIFYSSEEELRHQLVDVYQFAAGSARVSKLPVAVAVVHDGKGVIGAMYNLNSIVEIDGKPMVMKLPDEVTAMWAPIVQKYCDEDYSPILDPDF